MGEKPFHLLHLAYNTSLHDMLATNPMALAQITSGLQWSL